MLQVHVTSITQLQESIKKTSGGINIPTRSKFYLQAQLEGVIAKCNSLKKEIEKLEGELGALSDPNFSLENFNFLTNIL